MPINSGSVQRTVMLPGGAIDATGVYPAPLMATGGGMALTAAGANQAFTVALAGKYGFMTGLWLVPTALVAVANSITLLDASGGNILWNMPLLTGLPIGTMVQVKFENPLRTAAAGGQFYMTTAGAALTWSVGCNGYYDSALGN